jgi:hypothetical protein
MTQTCEVTTVIEISRQMNKSPCVSSVIRLLRHKDTQFVSWFKSSDKWILLADSFQLFVNSYANLRSPHRDQRHITNEQICLTPVSYFFISTQKHTIRSVIKDTGQMNSSVWSSSFICSLERRDTGFVPWRKSRNKRISLWDSVQFFAHFNTKTQNLYCDWSHMTNE